MVKFLAVASSGENPSDASALGEVSRPEEHVSLSEAQAHADRLSLLRDMGWYITLLH